LPQKPSEPGRMSQVVSQVRSLFLEAVYQPIGRPLGNKNPFPHHIPQFTLKRAPVDLRAERLKLLDVDAPVFEDVHMEASALDLPGHESERSQLRERQGSNTGAER